MFADEGEMWIMVDASQSVMRPNGSLRRMRQGPLLPARLRLLPSTELQHQR